MAKKSKKIRVSDAFASKLEFKRSALERVIRSEMGFDKRLSLVDYTDFLSREKFPEILLVFPNKKSKKKRVQISKEFIC